MSSKKRVPAPSRVAAVEEPEENETSAEEVEATEPKKPALSPAEAKALFVRYDTALSQRRELEELVRQKQYECSAAVREIAEKLGKGPFEWKGDRVTVVVRGDTAFLKTEGSRDVLKID